MSSAAFVFLDRMLLGDVSQGIAAPNAYLGRRVAALRADGHRVVLVSLHPEGVVQPLAHALGVRDVIATHSIHGQAQSSGEFLVTIHEWARSHGISLEASTAVTDSIIGVSLLNAVSRGVVVNPDAALRVMAIARRWAVEYWDRPEGVGSVFGKEPAAIAKKVLIEQLLPGARFEVAGLDVLPVEGPAIVASNHRSLYDAVALAVLAKRIQRPVRVMAKAELLAVPIVGRALTSLGVIGVDRDANPREAYRAARAILSAGEILAIMPEGTVPSTSIPDDATLAFKMGAARLAARSGAPLVPVAISGTDAVWPSGAKVPHLSALFRRPRVRIEFGAALVPTGSVAQDTQLLRTSIISMLKQSATMDEGNTAGEDTP
jgi:putative phosphoserine phosphatase / 1-acylglycerol-3-phosphate O-acyltransferase